MALDGFRNTSGIQEKIASEDGSHADAKSKLPPSPRQAVEGLLQGDPRALLVGEQGRLLMTVMIGALWFGLFYSILVASPSPGWFVLYVVMTTLTTGASYLTFFKSD